MTKTLGCEGITVERSDAMVKWLAPFAEKHRIRKDRTADGGNLPWSEGQTPIKEILQFMRKEKWTFPANVELEYRSPSHAENYSRKNRAITRVGRK